MSPFEKWLKLSYPKQLAAALAIGCIFLWRALTIERGKRDFYSDKYDSVKSVKIRECDERLRVKDSIISAKNDEIQFIYKTQADEYKKATAEVREIKKNSTTIYKRVKKMVREQ